MSGKRSDQPVVLARIYTRTGDDGQTALGDGTRVAKTDARITVLADIEELNAALGVAITLGELRPDLARLLRRVQNELFDAGADVCKPVSGGADLRIAAEYVARLEEECDHHNSDLPTLRSFVLPGGSRGAALLHVARTVARRAERSAWTAIDAYPDTTNVLVARYLNRLSDLLFILCRVANAEAGDVLWRPGGEREQ